jgi:hypothetical protein
MSNPRARTRTRNGFFGSLQELTANVSLQQFDSSKTMNLRSRLLPLICWLTMACGVCSQELVFLANHFNKGSNTLAELLPTVPGGGRLYKFDAVRQEWASVSTFQFGGWDRPTETLAPGEGAILEYDGTNAQWNFDGTIDPLASYPQIQGGWNLISLPIPESTQLPAPLGGDKIVRYTNSNYAIHYESSGGWSPPLPTLADSFWYFRNTSNPGAQPPRVPVVFDPQKPSPLMDGSCRLAGTNFLAQLYATTDLLGPFFRAGDPLPFLTGIGAGYLDTRSGSLRYLPSNIQPGSSVYMVVRLWDCRFGTNFETATGLKGQTEVVQSFFPAVSEPIMPIRLIFPSHYYLDGFNITSQPRDQWSFSGGSVAFSVATVSEAPLGPTNLTYQWQKRAGPPDCESTNPWVNLPNATGSNLTVNPVQADSAGLYRVIVTEAPAGRTRESQAALLQVLQIPRLDTPSYDPVHSSFGFLLNAEPLFHYDIEASEDLINWSLLKKVYSTDGQTMIQNTGTAGSTPRFYRARYSTP